MATRNASRRKKWLIGYLVCRRIASLIATPAAPHARWRYCLVRHLPLVRRVNGEYARDLLVRLVMSVALGVGQTLPMGDMLTSVSDAANHRLCGRSR